MSKKNTQEIEDERWGRLDRRIERVRARHELARLGMGTTFHSILWVRLLLQAGLP